MSTLVESATVPVEVTDCVRQSVLDIFTSMCGFQPEYRGTTTNGHACDGFIGIIAFVGDMDWSLMLGLPKKTSTSMATRFAGFEIDFESEDMGDVVGEMANIIAGDLVARMETMGLNIRMSTPSVARGSDMRIAIPDGLPPVQLNFDSPDGQFWVKFAVKK